jgi:hypothetical protein
MDDIEPPPPSTEPFGILKTMIRAEQEMIFAQRELLKLVGDENPMRIGIEEAMSHDAHHLDELWQIMPTEEGAKLEMGQALAGAATEPGGEMAGMAGMGAPEPPEAGLEGEPPPEGGGEPPAEEPPPEEPEPEGEREATAAARMAKWAAEKEPPTKKELKDKGRERAITSMAAEAERERSRRGERFGQALGSIGGAAGGALAGRKYVGGPVGTVGGAALGYLGGGKAGKELGTELDIAKNAAQAGPRVRGVYAMGPAQQKALYSQMVSSQGNWGGFGAQPTFGNPMGGGGMRASDAALLRSVGAFGKHGSVKEAAAAMRGSLAKMAQEMGEMGGDAQAPMASPTASDTEAQNYLAAEMAGRQAQEQNESSYYREQLGTAQQAAQMAQQQVADTTMQLQQIQQQAQEAGAQIQAATQQAVAAQDAATQQSLEAAKSRIGAQEMRSKMLELASQDPQALGEQALAPPPPAPGMEGMLAPPGMAPPPGAEGLPPEAGGPAPEEGAAGEAPAPPTPPAAAPAGEPGAGGPPAMGGPGGAPPGGGPAEAAAVPQMKVGAALGQHALGAGIGAAMGAGSSLYAGSQQPALADKVQQLEGAQTGGFMQAARLAAAKKALAGAELAQSHPGTSAIVGGLAGGAAGAIGGPRLAEKARATAGNVRDAMR